MREGRTPGRCRPLRGSAAASVIVGAIAATLVLSLAIVLAGFAGGQAAGPVGKGNTGSGRPEPPDPWSTAGAGADSIPRRGGLDGSVDVARLRASLTPLVSTSAQSPGTVASTEPVRMGLEISLSEKIEDGARAGFGDIGGPDRRIPVLTGSEAFPESARLPLDHARLLGWGNRFKK